jgi:hypothetical protein
LRSIFVSPTLCSSIVQTSTEASAYFYWTWVTVFASFFFHCSCSVKSASWWEGRATLKRSLIAFKYSHPRCLLTECPHNSLIQFATNCPFQSPPTVGGDCSASLMLCLLYIIQKCIGTLMFMPFISKWFWTYAVIPPN